MLLLEIVILAPYTGISNRLIMSLSLNRGPYLRNIIQDIFNTNFLNSLTFAPNFLMHSCLAYLILLLEKSEKGYILHLVLRSC